MKNETNYTAGPFLDAPAQIIEIVRKKLPEIINLVGDVFVSPWDLHQLDLAHRTLGGGSANYPSIEGRDGDISDSEDEIRDAMFGIAPRVSMIRTRYGVHYFLPGLAMDAATEKAYQGMSMSARFRVVLATKRALIALPGEEARDPLIVFGNHFWDEILESSGVLDQWFDRNEDQDDRYFEPGISKAFWLERRLHRMGFRGWRIVASEIDPTDEGTVSNVVAELNARFGAEFEPAGFNASGPAVRDEE